MSVSNIAMAAGVCLINNRSNASLVLTIFSKRLRSSSLVKAGCTAIEGVLFISPPLWHEAEVSLCILCVLCVTVVKNSVAKDHHRDTENTEVSQRILNLWHGDPVRGAAEAAAF